MAKKKVDEDSFIYFLAMLSIVIHGKLKKIYIWLPFPKGLKSYIKDWIFAIGPILLAFLLLLIFVYLVLFLLNIFILVIIGMDNTFKFFHISLSLEKFEMFSTKIDLRNLISW